MKARHQTRRATVRTSQSGGERIIKKTRIPFTGNPVDLITAAAQLVPQYRPRHLMLHLCSSNIFAGVVDAPPTDPTPELWISFGWEANVETRVSVALEPSDLLPLAVYLLVRCSGKGMGLVSATYLEDGGSGAGGEELPVPTISVDVLALLPTSTRVQ